VRPTLHVLGFSGALAQMGEPAGELDQGINCADDARPQAVMMQMYAQRGWSEKTTGKTQVFLQILFRKTTDSSPMWANTQNNLKDWNPDGITQFSWEIVISSISKRKYDRKSHRRIVHETRHICKIFFDNGTKQTQKTKTNEFYNLLLNFFVCTENQNFLNDVHPKSNCVRLYDHSCCSSIANNKQATVSYDFFSFNCWPNEHVAV
jgi:hypothetical protein